MSDILGAGLAFPLAIDGPGGLALVRGEEDIEQAVALILGTAPGERQMRPEFGCEIHDFVFETIEAATVGRMDRAVRAALDRWEPRIEVVAVDFDLTGVEQGMIGIEIGYRVRGTNRRNNLVYPFYVVPAEEPA